MPLQWESRVKQVFKTENDSGEVWKAVPTRGVNIEVKQPLHFAWTKALQSLLAPSAVPTPAAESNTLRDHRRHCGWGFMDVSGAFATTTPCANPRGSSRSRQRARSCSNHSLFPEQRFSHFQQYRLQGTASILWPTYLLPLRIFPFRHTSSGHKPTVSKDQLSSAVPLYCQR